ncbi:MAG: choice-of-anchor L domain-containing protein [Bacteroidales bacterium]
MKNKTHIAVALLLIISFSAQAQLQINKNISVPNLVQNVLIGSGVTVSNVTYSGSPDAFGKFTNGNATSMNISSGLIMSTGDVSDAPGPNSSGSITTNNGTGSDPQLAALIPGYTVNDAAVIEFDFVPIGDTLKFRYVFGSDEYPEFVNSSFNDVFGFFVSGPNPGGGQYNNYNIARIPGTTLPVTIDNVNNGTTNNGPCMNCQYYYDNMNGVTIEYDGHTTILTAQIVVTPCMNYHFKIAIGDAGDSSFDSAVFIEEGSFATDAVEIITDYTVPGAGNEAIEGCNDIIIQAKLNKIKPQPYVVHIDTMYGTATNGVDFPLIPDSIVIQPAHLTGEIVISPIADQIPEGTEYFNLVIQTSVCYVDTITVPILDYTPIQLTSSPDTLICQDSAMLNVSPQYGNPPYSYSWSPMGSLNNATVPNPIASPASSTTYLVTVIDTTGCPPVTDTIDVTVSPKPNVSFLPQPTDGCEPLQVQFDDMSSSATVDWQWHFGDGNSSTAQSPTHTYDAGTYDVKLIVTTNDGCSDSLELNNIIESYPQPVADFSANPPIVSIDNPTIDFIDNSTNGTFWFWDFGEPGNADTSNQTNPTYTYYQDGQYTVMMITYTDKGCADTAYHDVDVIVDKIKIPNVITPNGDGHNDVFRIENITRMRSSKLVIYNRWGKKIYISENYQNDWDGDNYADGTYYFVLEYETLLEKRSVSGVLTILRD